MRARGIQCFKLLVFTGDIVWDAEGRAHLGLAANSPLLPEVREDAVTLRALLRRLTVFTRQLQTPDRYPFVHLKSRVARGTCDACGAKVPEHSLGRCELCFAAASAALDLLEARDRERAPEGGQRG